MTAPFVHGARVKKALQHRDVQNVLNSRIVNFFAELPFQQRDVIDNGLRVERMHGAGVR